MATPVQITIDCADPAKLAGFWAEVLGYIVEPPPDGYASWAEVLAARGVPESEWNSANAAIDPEGTGPRIFFQRVPESKSVKNRVHLDVNAGGPRDTPADEKARRVEDTVKRLVAAGATVAVEHAVGLFGESWVVMNDPEGNEFCVQ